MQLALLNSLARREPGGFGAAPSKQAPRKNVNQVNLQRKPAARPNLRTRRAVPKARGALPRTDCQALQRRRGLRRKPCSPHTMQLCDWQQPK